MKPLFFILLISVLAFSVSAQSPVSAEDFVQELQARGVSEQEVQAFLASKGLTVNDLENLDPSQYVSLNDEFDLFIEDSRRNGINQKSVSDIEPAAPQISSTPPVVIRDTVERNNTGKSIKIYGEQLFNNQNFSLLSGDGLVPGSYILDVGDEVSVSIFGNSQLNKIFTVNSDGAILYNNNRKRVLVAGLSLNDARIKLEKVFRNSYNFSAGEFSVNVVGARTIAVSVYGEVANSGGYILSAVNSPVNAIQAAGGINPDGSYRNIKIIKNNGTVKDIDLYKYLIDPSEFIDVGLSNNDVIHVPTRNNLVTIKGAIVKPLMYELKPRETFQDLIDFCGGFQSDANTNTIELRRFVDGKLKIINLDYSNSNSRSTKLVNGDVINIFTLEGTVENSVSVSGMINNPGTFELTSGMKVSDLIRSVIFNPESRLDVALIKRVDPSGKTNFIKVNLQEVLKSVSSSQNIALQSGDELLVWSLARFVDSANNLQIAGAVKYPGKYAYREGGTYVSDMVFFAGGLRRDASKVGMIYRKDPLNENEVEYIRFNPFTKPGADQDLLLMPFDSIVVLKDESISNSFSVEIRGMVKNPGIFQYGAGMSVKDLVVLAEGFELSALTNQIEINRIIIEDTKPTQVKIGTVAANPDLSKEDESSNYILEPFDMVFVRSVSEFEKQQTIKLIGEVKYPGTYVILDKNEKISSLIKRAGGLTSQAFIDGARLNRTNDSLGLVVMNLDQAMKVSNSKYNYILKAGDELTIPKKKDIVTLKSDLLYKRNTNLADQDLEVTNSLSVAYFPGKRADFYIKKFAGGFDERSDKANIFVEHPNGEVAETKNYGLIKTYPVVRAGSTIVIPTIPKQTEEDKANEEVDWTKLLGDSVTQAMSIITLLLLIERI